MASLVNKNKSINWGLTLLLGMVFIPQLFMPTLMAPDSGSYISMSSDRPPLLPLILQIDVFLFAEHFFIFHILQIGLIFYALTQLDIWLRGVFCLKKWVISLLTLIFLIPTYIYFPSGRYILTEAICFPLFILMFIALNKLLIDKGLKQAFKFSFWVVLLSLTREQFYYLFVVMPIVLVWFAYFKIPLKQIIKMGFIFIGSLMVLLLAERSYHYMLTGNFKSSTAKGSLLLVQPLFLANEEDGKHFKDPKLRDTFLMLYQENYNKGYLLNSIKPINAPNFDKLNVYANFYQAFDPIQEVNKRAISRTFKLSSFEVNKLYTEIALTLLHHNIKNNLSFFIWKIIYSFGGYYYTLIWIFLTVMLFFKAIQNKQDFLPVTCLALLLLSLGNSMVIALSEMMLPRYLAYSFLAMLILISLLASQALGLVEDE